MQPASTSSSAQTNTATNPHSGPAVTSQSLRRAPSLQELVDTMKSQNPQKWERLTAARAQAAQEDSLTVAGHASSLKSVPMGYSKSHDPVNAKIGSGASNLNPHSSAMAKSASTTSTSSSTTINSSDADTVSTSSSLETPRLRLTARLAAAAPAPLLSRSQSTNAVFHSSDPTAANNAGDAKEASIREDSGYSGTSLPALSDLQSTLARRSSVSTASGGKSLSSRGLPSLEAIEKRFALKKEKEGQKDKDELAVPTNALAVASSAPSQLPSLGASSMKSKQPFTSSKENIDPKTGLDASQKIGHHPRSEISSSSMIKSTSSSSSGSSSASPTTPTDVVHMPLGEKTMKADEHPLEHKWTLYFDSRATAFAAKAAAAAAAEKPVTPTSAGHPSGTTSGKLQWEAGLSKLGSVNTVETFCRLYNWLKKPSKMGMNENLHFFKEDILPMWEDETNRQGGKWIICVDSKIMNCKELIDKLWMWLTFALIGEDFDDKNEHICGAVVSTRPRMYRFQVWLKNRDDVTSVNTIGKHLIRLLELEHPTTGARTPGISLEFAYHSRTSPPANKFLHIAALPIPAASSAFQAPPGSIPGGLQAKSLTPSYTSSSLASLSRPPGFGNAFGSIGLARAASMNAIAKLAQNGDLQGQQMPSGGGMKWRERLGQTSRKSSLAA